MKPIYEPKGAAKEYGDLALNIYTGCPHRCYYCFAPSVLRRDREKFHSDVAAAGVTIVQDIRIRIREGGDILMEALNGMQTMDFRMTLANYKRLWRVWQNGMPTEAQRLALRWG